MRTDELPDDPELGELLSRLDHATPIVTVADIRRRANVRRGSRWRRAASIALLGSATLAGALYAAPASLLPTWLVELRARIGLVRPADPEVPDSAPGVATERPGVALEIERPVTIEVGPSGAAGWVRVSLTEGALVEVRSPSTTTHFTSEPARLVVEHTSPDTLDVRVPRGALRVELRVAGRPQWTAEHGAVEADVATRGGDDVWLFALVSPPG